jgi:riboflavin biosynthesis pyrimidine reductase
VDRTNQRANEWLRVADDGEMVNVDEVHARARNCRCELELAAWRDELVARVHQDRSGDVDLFDPVLRPVPNRIPKVVVSRSAPALDAWSNSSLLEGELVAGVADLTREQDVVVVGSTSVVHALAAADAVDEYRLLVIPTALGAGERLFVAPVDLQLTSIETAGEAVLARYDRTARA